MLSYVLQRYSDNGESTLGLFFDLLSDRLKFLSYVIEDTRREIKVPGQTRIDAGVYPLELRRELTPLTAAYREKYPWFTWHIEIKNVPNFSDTYVHIGNRAKDSAGCTLTGDSANNNSVGEGFVGNSLEAYRRWYTVIAPYLTGGGLAQIDIRDESWLM